MSGPAATPLSALPRDRVGIRQRGLEMTRTETFTDAAFAFAVTLLVISIDAVPTSYDDMVRALEGIPAFGLSFALLAMFWHGHWQWSRRFGLEDGPSILLSLVLVFVILTYVYPLKYLATLFVAWVSGGGIGGQVGLTGADELGRIFAIYGVGFIAANACLVGLNLHAYRRREALMLDPREAFGAGSEAGAWALAAGVGGLSVGVALLLPDGGAWAGFAYMLLPVVMPTYGVVQTRRAARRFDTVAAGPASAAEAGDPARPTPPDRAG